MRDQQPIYHGIDMLPVIRDLSQELRQATISEMPTIVSA
jgi:hypothetical protein